VMMVPILNLFCISYAVVFYTVIWVLKNDRDRISEDILKLNN